MARQGLAVCCKNAQFFYAPPPSHTFSPCPPLPPVHTFSPRPPHPLFYSPLPYSFVNVATEFGFTPLHYAVTSNFPNISLLLSNGASMCCRTLVPEGYDILSCENWSTPLHLATMKGRTVCTLELLKHCVSVAGHARACMLGCRSAAGVQGWPQCPWGGGGLGSTNTTIATAGVHRSLSLAVS